MTKVCVFGLTLLTYCGSVERYRWSVLDYVLFLSSLLLSFELALHLFPPPSFLPCSLSLPALLHRATMTLM